MNSVSRIIVPTHPECKLELKYIERFWTKVIFPVEADGCWLWGAGKDASGYGNFWNGAATKGSHRVVWEISNGCIPGKLQALHKCDVTACVNPNHLFLGTDADNVADKVAKNRQAQGDSHGSRRHPERLARGAANGSRRHPERLARGAANGARLHPERLARGAANGARLHPERMARGEANGSGKLTEDLVRKIRKLYAAGEVTHRALAKMFQVAPTTINKIVLRKTWAHVP